MSANINQQSDENFSETSVQKNYSLYEIGKKLMVIEKVANHEQLYLELFVKANSYSKMSNLYMESAKQICGLNSNNVYENYHFFELERFSFWEEKAKSIKTLMEMK